MSDPLTNPTTPVSLLNLGRAWTRVGYVVLALTVVAFVLNVVYHPVLPHPPGGTMPAGYRSFGGKDGGLAVLASGAGIISVFLLVFSALAAFVWTFIDIIDRRKRFVWLLPAFICPLVLALHALPLALYLFFGRETIGHGENVQ